MRPKQQLSLVALILAAAGTGCSGDSTAPILGLPSPQQTADGALPAPTPPPTPLAALLMPTDLVVGTPTDVYTRIARGVLTCWFGSDGPLKSRYIYHAEAEPASKGGSSEIKIMTRDHDAEDPRALRAYRILIAPSAGATRVEAENVRLPEPLAVRLGDDVKRWSADEPGCGEGPVTAGWTAEEPDPKNDSKNNGKSK